MMVAEPDRPEVSVDARCHRCGAGESVDCILCNCDNCGKPTCAKCVHCVPLSDGGTFDVCKDCDPPRRAKRRARKFGDKLNIPKGSDNP